MDLTEQRSEKPNKRKFQATITWTSNDEWSDGKEEAAYSFSQAINASFYDYYVEHITNIKEL